MTTEGQYQQGGGPAPADQNVSQLQAELAAVRSSQQALNARLEELTRQLAVASSVPAPSPAASITPPPAVAPTPPPNPLDSLLGSEFGRAPSPPSTAPAQLPPTAAQQFAPPPPPPPSPSPSTPPPPQPAAAAQPFGAPVAGNGMPNVPEPLFYVPPMEGDPPREPGQARQGAQPPVQTEVTPPPAAAQQFAPPPPPPPPAAQQFAPPPPPPAAQQFAPPPPPPAAAQQVAPPPPAGPDFAATAAMVNEVLAVAP
ncbi:MAG: hypothetical protein M0007_03680, partial [Actinomycetota bacterium]|nr:hypothetical protein [Actinomycetota bacterium]